MSAQLVVCDLTFQAFPGGEQWEVARLARVNEQLLRVAETHVQELHGENVMMSRRRQVIGAGTGSAGTQSLSGRERQGQEPQAP
jgi:hypothetical protein